MQGDRHTYLHTDTYLFEAGAAMMMMMTAAAAAVATEVTMAVTMMVVPADG